MHHRNYQPTLNCLTLLRALLCIIKVLTVLSVSYQEEYSSSGVFENVCHGCRVTSLILQVKKVTNLFQCIHKCQRNKICKFVNYKHFFSVSHGVHETHGDNQDSHNCELLESTMNSSGKKEFAKNWEHYRIIRFVSSQYFTE